MKLGFLSKSRGFRNVISRVFTVTYRFGLSPKRFENLLKKYYEITNKANCLPTFAITAVVLARHPDYIKELSRKGVEFAVHGYVHVDYKVLSIEEKKRHIKKAINIFNMCEIPFEGFRAPFLRVNKNTTPILSNFGFVYHSSRVLYWPVIELKKFSGYARNNHNLLLEFCAPLDANKYFSLPKFENGLVEIPVSLPDDETIIERLGIYDKKKISKIWLELLQKIYQNGELFVLSLHPERIDYCDTALADVLNKAREFNPSVWVTTMKEIAEWWRERAGFNLKIIPVVEGKYRVQAECSSRATIIMKNARVNSPVDDWFNGYKIVNGRDFIMESPKRPVVGVSPDSSAVAVNFLKSEGYIVEVGIHPEDYAIYFKDLTQTTEADEKLLAQRIDQANVPIVRYWRWPDRARSAMSITGDIDSLTVIDFVLRVLEDWQSSKRS
jgi:peptidoglycan/xylan/chitin deacetylase (PgdA/CDA1 family)